MTDNKSVDTRQNLLGTAPVGRLLRQFAVPSIIAMLVSALHKLHSHSFSPQEVLGYAQEYVRIMAIGVPFLIFYNGGAHLVRADGSPVYSMISNITGVINNTVHRHFPEIYGN